MTTRPPADVIHIGYPKTASTFINRYLENHPEVTAHHNRVLPLLWPQADGDVADFGADKQGGMIQFSRDELIGLSMCITGDPKNWSRHLFIPGAWDKVKGDVVLDPAMSARRIRQVCPNAKILLTTREQTDWLNSAYKYGMSSLPAGKRAFADFCATPAGIAYLQAGHFDQTIRAYVDVFGSQNVRVLRYEDLVSAPERFVAELCGFIGISVKAIPQRRENETNSQIARILRLFPIIERLPANVKAALKPHAARVLPGGRGVLLSARDIQMVHGIYAASNERTDKLLAQLAAAPVGRMGSSLT